MGKFCRQCLKVSSVDKVKIEPYSFAEENKILSLISMELNLE